MRALPLSSSQNFCSQSIPLFSIDTKTLRSNRVAITKFGGVRAKAKNEADGEKEEDDANNKKKSKQSLFGSITEALDFSQVRSSEDARLLDKAREATRSGEKMTREQYGALRRKIGGTYQDFFKSSIEVDGEYVEEGWVDKTCKVCKKDTRGEPRQVDKFGRYVHVACLDRSKSTNFFSKFFS